MKIKPGFRLRNICGEQVIIAEGKTNIDFNSIIRLNETAVVVWNAVWDKEFNVDDMAEAILKEYEIDKATATADCQALACSWLQAGILVSIPEEPQQPEAEDDKDIPAPIESKETKPQPAPEKDSLFKKVKKTIGNLFS